MNANPSEPDSYQSLAWVQALRGGLSCSDEKIRAASLNEGWSVVHHRGRVIRAAMQAFYEKVTAEAPPRGAFAIHALGGTGRREMCPGSDVDIGIVVENVEENRHFLNHVSGQLRQFARHVPGLRDVVKANAFPDLKDHEHFDLASLVSLLDGDLLVGDGAFDDRIRRVCRERAAEFGLEFIFAINKDLRQFEQQYPQLPGDVRGFHVKNGIGGLRAFQMTMWLYAFERWIPSVEVYQQVRTTRRFDSEGAPTPEVLDAVSIIFSARCWIEQRRQQQAASDAPRRPSRLFIDASDMDAFLKRFGAEGLHQLNRAREIISAYRHETFDRLLEYGVVVPDTDGVVVWGTDGLRMQSDALFKDTTEMFYSIYGAQQRFDLPIAKSVKRAARKNIADSLQEHPGFIRLMVQAGSIVPALSDWSTFGILEKLLPGFSQLANQRYTPKHRTAALTLAARAMQRVGNLEHLDSLNLIEAHPLEPFFRRQYEDLGPSARCALRLALLTEETPETLYGREQYDDSAVKYVDQDLATISGLSLPTLATIKLLLLTKRDFIQAADMGDQDEVIQSWRSRIKSSGVRDAANTVRALALFTYAAFDFRNPDPTQPDRLNSEQWQNVQNFTQNLLYQELGISGQPFQDDYFDQTGKRIGNLLPRRLLASRHVDNTLKQTYEGNEILDPQRAHRIIYALREVVQTTEPKVELRREDDHYRMILFAWDFPGLFWRVAGTLYDKDCSIRSTDLYTIPDPGGAAVDGETLIDGEPRLICDVLTFDAPSGADEPWEEELKQRMLQRLQNPSEQFPDNIAAILQPVMDGLCPRITDLGGGQAKFSCHSPTESKGTRYAISRLLSERAGASIESIARDGTRDWPVPRTNFYLRISTNADAVAAALREELGHVPVSVDTLS